MSFSCPIIKHHASDVNAGIAVSPRRLCPPPDLKRP
jgi:hypothetical protein